LDLLNPTEVARQMNLESHKMILLGFSIADLARETDDVSVGLPHALLHALPCRLSRQPGWGEVAGHIVLAHSRLLLVGHLSALPRETRG
jgi:hypothetical protein